MKLSNDYSMVTNDDINNILKSSYAKKIINRMRNSFRKVDPDDFDSSVNLALIKVAKFMKQKNSDVLAKKETILTRFLRNELIGILNYNDAKKRGNDKTNHDISCMISRETNPDISIDVKDILNKISYESAYLLVEKHLKNRTLAELGTSLGCTRENVRQLLEKAYIEFKRGYDA